MPRTINTPLLTHTPGPWEVHPFLTPNEDEDPMMVYAVSAGDLVTRFANVPMDDEGNYDELELEAIHSENEANARLIAAAPELLEALKNLLIYDTSELPGDFIEAAKGAIALAEGKD